MAWRKFKWTRGGEGSHLYTQNNMVEAKWPPYKI